MAANRLSRIIQVPVHAFISFRDRLIHKHDGYKQQHGRQQSPHGTHLQLIRSAQTLFREVADLFVLRKRS
jgi:hypothetical protein